MFLRHILAHRHLLLNPIVGMRKNSLTNYRRFLGFKMDWIFNWLPPSLGPRNKLQIYIYIWVQIKRVKIHSVKIHSPKWKFGKFFYTPENNFYGQHRSSKWKFDQANTHLFPFKGTKRLPTHVMCLTPFSSKEKVRVPSNQSLWIL